MFCAFAAPQSRDGLLLSCAVKIQNAKCRMQNAKFKMFLLHLFKFGGDELFLCDARRQNRSIVSLCEDFGVRSTRAKRANQNEFSSLLLLADPSSRHRVPSRVRNVRVGCGSNNYSRDDGSRYP